METSTAPAPVETSTDSKPVEDVGSKESSPLVKSGEDDSKPGDDLSVQKFTLKNRKTGQVEEIGIEKMQELAQKAWAADNAMREVDNRIKNRDQEIAQELQQAAAKDPIGLLKLLNPSFKEDEFLQSSLSKKLEWESMSEEQRKLYSEKQEIEQWRKEKDEYERTQNEQRSAAATREFEQNFNNEVIESLEKSGILKSKALATRGPEIARRIANYKLLALKNGADLSASKALDLVVQDLKNEASGFWGDVEDSKILDMMDKNLVNKIAKATVNGGKANSFTTNKVGQSSPNSRKQKKMTTSEFKEYLDNLS